MAAVTPYTAPDYYLLDDLFSEELKMIRGAVRDFIESLRTKKDQ